MLSDTITKVGSSWSTMDKGWICVYIESITHSDQWCTEEGNEYHTECFEGDGILQMILPPPSCHFFRWRVHAVAGRIAVWDTMGATTIVWSTHFLFFLLFLQFFFLLFNSFICKREKQTSNFDVTQCHKWWLWDSSFTFSFPLSFPFSYFSFLSFIRLKKRTETWRTQIEETVSVFLPFFPFFLFFFSLLSFPFDIVSLRGSRGMEDTKCLWWSTLETGRDEKGKEVN